MRTAAMIALAGGLLCSVPAIADVRHAIGPQPGLACMSLKLTEQQAMDPSYIVPLRAEPSETSQSVGQLGSIALVRYPYIQRNGFLAAVLFNGRTGWVEKSELKPWESPNGGSHVCIPSKMSDGSIGFAFK